jgi:hypothetical protein
VPAGTAYRFGANWGKTKLGFGGSFCIGTQRKATQRKERVAMDNAHISALQAKHSGLDRKIAAEIARPLPDMSLLATLKKQKLRLKEALVGL